MGANIAEATRGQSARTCRSRIGGDSLEVEVGKCETTKGRCTHQSRIGALVLLLAAAEVPAAEVPGGGACVGRRLALVRGLLERTTDKSQRGRNMGIP